MPKKTGPGPDQDALIALDTTREAQANLRALFAQLDSASPEAAELSVALAHLTRRWSARTDHVRAGENDHPMRRVQFLIDLRKVIDGQLDHAVADARQAKHIWSEIADVLEVSTQAANRKYRHTSTAPATIRRGRRR